MPKENLINRTIGYLHKMPEDKVEEVFHFVESLYGKYEDFILQKGIEKLSTKSDCFEYLEKEEDIYTVNDLKERYK